MYLKDQRAIGLKNRKMAKLKKAKAASEANSMRIAKDMEILAAANVGSTTTANI